MDKTPARLVIFDTAYRVLTVVALILAVAGILTLAVVIAGYLAHFSVPGGLLWVPMFSLPVAFVLMVIALVLAALRRRRL